MTTIIITHKIDVFEKIITQVVDLNDYIEK